MVLGRNLKEAGFERQGAYVWSALGLRRGITWQSRNISHSPAFAGRYCSLLGS